MTNDLPELPDGWTWCRGKDLFVFIRGVSYRKEDAQSTADSNCVAILRAGNLQNGRVLTDDLIYVPSRYVSDLQRLRSGDLIVAMSSGSASVVGKVSVAEIDLSDTSFGTFCGGLRAHIAGFRRWLFHFFQTSKYRTLISSEAAGININNLRAEHLLDLYIPLPPTPELNRLVAKIEALQARSRKAREALDAIPLLLEQFRQSVLAAAFRDDLTAEWREKYSDIEPASVLLERIRQERRRKWEDANPHKKYVEPEPVDDSDLPELPMTWRWAGFAECTWEITVGHVGSMKHRYIADGIPFLRSQNVRPMKYDPASLVFIPAEFDAELRKSRLSGGEILIVRSGANVGDCCVYPYEAGLANCSDVVISRPLEGLLADFGALFINTPDAQTTLGLRTVGNAQAHFNIGAMKTTAFPLAPVEEQREIIRRIDLFERHRLGVLAEVRKGIDEAARLDQSILAKAFRGELVPQDPADEPASVLLERIRAAANGEAHVSTSKRRRRRSET